MFDFYTLDEQADPVAESDIRKWSEWFEKNIDTRSVGDDMFDYQGREIRVSTVFLSIPHIMKDAPPGAEPTALYETMIFADEDIIEKLMELAEQGTQGIIAMFLGRPEVQKRYETKAEAIAGHKVMFNFVQFAMKRMPVYTKQE